MPSVFCLNCVPESSIDEETDWLRLWRAQRSKSDGKNADKSNATGRTHWLTPSFIVDSIGKFNIRPDTGSKDTVEADSHKKKTTTRMGAGRKSMC